MGPPPGMFYIDVEELGLELRAADIEPWILTWRDLLRLVELVRFCFVDKRVFYEFRANVWIDDIFREIVDVVIWKPSESDVGNI